MPGGHCTMGWSAAEGGGNGFGLGGVEVGGGGADEGGGGGLGLGGGEVIGDRVTAVDGEP